MRRGPVTIQAVRGRTRRYRSLLHRADGVTVELEGGSYNRVGGPAGELPHDLAHHVVETELGLAHGVWGVLAEGGLFRGARVLAGRRPPHHDRRAAAVLARHVEALNQAEVLTRAVCDAALAGRADVAAVRAAAGARWWSDTVTVQALERCFDRLHHDGVRWARLRPGEALDLTWPLVPPSRVGGRT